MSKYDKYKTSGIEWIGDVPEHWERKRFRYSFENSKGLSITKENLIEVGIPCVNYGEIHSKYGFKVDPEVNELLCVDEKYLETNQLSILSEGDFVFADTSEDIEGSGNFTHLVGNQKIFAGYHTIISRLRVNAVPRFVAFYFDSVGFRNQIRREIQGVKVFSITNKILKDTILFLPEFSEQLSIANYLDKQTQKIDRLIANKKTQADKLKELRQIEINNTVTKGLNPNAEIKDSGIEWLGKIPKHWKVNRLKNSAFINQSVISEKTAFDFILKYIDISNVNSIGEFIELQEMEFSEAPSRARRIPKHNSILLSTVRTYLRAIAFVQNPDDNLIASTGFAVIDANQILFNAEYLFYQMISHNLVERVIANSEGVSYPAISSTKLGEIKVLIPPIEEQTKIANYLKKRTLAVDQLIKNIEAQIEKLQELRKIKIYEAVTGKI